MPTTLAKQLRKPSGFLGNLVAKMMEFRNRNSYKEIISNLSLVAGDSILEIGYGPGLGIYRIASSFPGCRINGIDYSELMYQKASRLNKKFIERGTVRLQYGDILTLEPGNVKYDKIFCLNVIYFWNDLSLAFSRIFNMLGPMGKFLIYMDHMDNISKAKFLADFCKYPIEEVERELKNAGFADIEYSFAGGYFIRAKKTVPGNS
jgi:cyclopropane fatty-acyl-phospholipid synthase-like methyltransferase